MAAAGARWAGPSIACNCLHALDGFNDLAIYTSRILHALAPLNEKRLLLATPPLRWVGATSSRRADPPSRARSQRIDPNALGGVRPQPDLLPVSCQGKGRERGHRQLAFGVAVGENADDDQTLRLLR